MDGEEKIIEELLKYGEKVMRAYKIYPYVSFIAKNGVVIARGRNTDREHPDVTLQDQVVAIRAAQEALDTGDLSRYTLYSLFEPTILGFDVALWAGIKRFVWCANKISVPNHYNNIHYGPLDYLANHPGEIFIKNGIHEKEGLRLIQTAQQNHYYPDNLQPT